jgi:hypothetical protein
MVGLLGLPTRVSAQPVGNPVVHWNEIAVATLTAFPAPAGSVPPALQIHLGMVHGAVYDAVNAIVAKHHRPYALDRRFGVTSSRHAAVATAAHDVLANIVTTVPDTIAFPNRAALLQSLDTAYGASLAEIPNGPFKTNGIRAGAAAADAMIAARQGDGRFGPSQWVPNSTKGHWQPLLNAQGAPILDPTPWVGRVRPFFLDSPSQFRTAGPYALTSAQYAADFNEVKSLGAVNSVTRTETQTHIARFWQSNVPPAWNAVTRAIVGDPQWGIDINESAWLFAMQNMAAADAAINCWNDKYHYDFWRPWNAIPRAGEDDNPATAADATWAALITAPYPDHPSGHLCLDGAHLRVLSTFLGTDNVRFGVTSVVFPGEVRTYDRFSDVLAEIIEARIWAGLHVRNADVQGLGLGRNVAGYALANFLKPVGRS